MSTFGKNFKAHRRKLCLSQEEISEKLGVTPQAISKWECERSYPDIDMFINIAHFFDISLDSLLTGEERVRAERQGEDRVGELLGLPDDDTIRVVLCRGKYILNAQQGCGGIKIPLVIEGELEKLEVRGSADIEGNVYGSISTGTSLSARSIEGMVVTGTSLEATSINGSVICGSSMHCGNIDGDVQCGGSLFAENITGDIKSCGGDINIESLNGDIKECRGSIYHK